MLAFLARLFGFASPLLPPPPLGEGTRALLALLTDEPSEKWSRDSYYCVHESGIGIWIANQDYGLTVWAGEWVDTDRVSVDLRKWDGRNWSKGPELRLPGPDRKAIWDAYCAGSAGDQRYLLNRLTAHRSAT